MKRLGVIIFILVAVTGSSCGLVNEHSCHFLHYPGCRFHECDGIVDEFIADVGGGDDRAAWSNWWIIDPILKKRFRLDSITLRTMEEIEISDSSFDGESRMTTFRCRDSVCGFVNGELRYFSTMPSSNLMINNEDSDDGIRLLDCSVQELEKRFGKPTKTVSVRYSGSSP